MQRGADLLRRTAVFVEPLVFNNSLHSHSRDELRQCVLPCDALNGFLNVEKPRQPMLVWIQRLGIRSSEDKNVTIR
jgi:hypothetical protein